MARLSKEQAAIIGAFTGISCGPFSDVHEYAEKKMGRPCWTHEFGYDDFCDALKSASRDDFLSICHECHQMTQMINKNCFPPLAPSEEPRKEGWADLTPREAVIIGAVCLAGLVPGLLFYEWMVSL